MKIRLAYGKTGLEVEVPERNLLKVLTMDGAQPLADPEEELRRALDHPVSSLPLLGLARKARSACVVISDITRPVPNRILLPPVLGRLELGGIDPTSITILIATGLHRASTGEERRILVGDDILEKYRVVDHNARAFSEQVSLGWTKNGTPVYIDRVYCDAELKITTGFIEPHLMAGFSGGRKLVAPGCAGELTIKALHSPFFLEDPLCCEGSVEENPLHHELLEIAAMAGHDFIVNVSLDTLPAITGVFAGDPLQAHASGIAHVRRSVTVTVPEPADIVITTGAGFPLDRTFYQSIKGMTAALPVVKKGGMLILAAECAEGLGSPEFTSMARGFRNVDAFVETMSGRPVVIDQWQLEECAKAARKANITLVSRHVATNFPDSLFIRTVQSLDDALVDGLNKYGDNASIIVIPNGPYTLVGVKDR